MTPPLTPSKTPSKTISSKKHADITVAQRVIAEEIAALESLKLQIGEEFSQAIALIMSIQGRVIVSGIGKSGHIGRKIAATLSSTGTPALFLHPSEASHGDLGMITQADLLLALSNSGNTQELTDMIYYSRRFKIPLIAMVGQANSALAHAADIVLLLPDVGEASQISAPTTSTTMMLALGDALAVTLQEHKGFTINDFKMVHPGGRLGVAFKHVSDIMHHGDAVPLVRAESPMSSVLITITEHAFGCVGVSDDGCRLLGVITDGDLRRHMTDGLLERCAREVMTLHPRTIHSSAMAAEALQRMQQYAITSLFVVDEGVNGGIRGIVHIHDCLRAGVA